MLMNVNECAKYLGVCTKTLYKWCKTGYIPHQRLGTWLIKFDKDVIDEWVKKECRA